MSGENIPLNDLSRHWQQTAPVVKPAVERVAASGRYVLGQEVATFERAFADYCGVRHCIGVGSGTDALELVLRALGCGAGDEVITVANAGPYAAAAILATGARPRFVDIDATSMTICADALAQALERPARALIVTHLYGQLADMEALAQRAARHGLLLIEDCAQAHEAERGGRRAGAWGTAGCFSFYPTKNLGALGDAGAVVTDNDALAERVARLRQYGWTTKYHAAEPGGRNSRLDELQAAVLHSKLPYLDRWNERRRAIAADYGRGLAACDLVTPAIGGPDHVAHLYVVRSQRRDALRRDLEARGIATEVHYPVAEPRQPALRGLTVPAPALPETERAVSQVLSLPCFPEMTQAEVALVTAAVKDCCRPGEGREDVVSSG